MALATAHQDKVTGPHMSKAHSMQLQRILVSSFVASAPNNNTNTKRSSFQKDEKISEQEQLVKE